LVDQVSYGTSPFFLTARGSLSAAGLSSIFWGAIILMLDSRNKIDILLLLAEEEKKLGRGEI
jgi:hypothetical protein